MAINSTYSVPNGTSSNRTSSFIKYMFCFMLFGLLSLEGFGQGASYTWTGNVSTDWDDSGNWDGPGNKFPNNNGAAVTIGNSQNNNYPVIDDQTIVVKSISMDWNGNLTVLNGAILNVSKDMIINGVLTITNSSLDIGGDFSSNRNLTISNSTITVTDFTYESSGSNNMSLGSSVLDATGNITINRPLTSSINSIIKATNFTLTASGGSQWDLDNTQVFITGKFKSERIVNIKNSSNIETSNFELTRSGQSTVNIYDKCTLTVKNNLSMDNFMTIYDGGSLIQLKEGVDSNIIGNSYTNPFTVERIATIARNTDYVYWASPVQGFSVDNIGSTSHRYEWQPTVENNDTYLSDFGNWKKATGTMTPGQGYIVRGFPTINGASENEYTQRFQNQKPNNGLISIPVFHGGYDKGTYNEYDSGNSGPSTTKISNEDDNWNLIGNPYPSAISIEKFLTENEDVLEGGVRIWTHGSAISTEHDDPFYQDFVYNYSSSDYFTHTATGPSTFGEFSGYIASGQGFFVTVIHNDYDKDNEKAEFNVNFTNAMRQLESDYDNADFYRTDEASQKSRIWLSLSANETKSSNSMLLGYINGATIEKDNIYDAVIMDYNIMSIHSLINEEPMVIQGRPLPFVNSDEVPLGVILKDKDLYTIGISQVDGLFEEGQDIYLEDTYENITHDLRKSPYQFAAEAGTFNDRFVLRYQANKLDVEDAVINTNFKIIATRDFIKVSSTTSTVNSIVVYDVLGRVLYQANKLNAAEVKLDQFKPTNSPLIVKATLSNGTEKAQKVIY
ncbi:hypothetical protein [Formosa sp. PL04]|uniref:hypothetical protein n=1 Tax=Formosa sp. PL04 TaxID=3081755 RepID=UPI002981B804|nr:hypothetical protein [Formosa sp. PL04]MDW5287597.1 hypothetical protein [Formosa sp. PL04]